MGLGWLKSIGQIALKGSQIAAGANPIIGAISAIAPLLPGQAGRQAQAAIAATTASIDTFNTVAAVIAHAEIMGAALALSGPDKLKAAAPAVAQMLLQSAVVAGRPIADQAGFMAGATKIADGMVAVLNSLSAETTPVAGHPNLPPAPPAPPVT